ncbi:hypothetical protein [Pseudomonas sp. S3_A03]
MRKIITLVAAFSLAACATQYGKPVTHGQLDQIKQSVTTENDLANSSVDRWQNPGTQTERK